MSSLVATLTPTWKKEMWKPNIGIKCSHNQPLDYNYETLQHHEMLKKIGNHLLTMRC